MFFKTFCISLFVFVSMFAYLPAQILIEVHNCKDSTHVLQGMIEVKTTSNLVILRASLDSTQRIIVPKKMLKYRKEIKITCKTIFGEMNKSVQLNEKHEQNIKICVDYANEQRKKISTFISSLQDGENYTLVWNSSGCFHKFTDTLTIQKTKGVYKAVLKSYYSQAHAKILEKQLSKIDLDLIDNLEHELQIRFQSLNTGGCTTQEYYILSNAHEVRQYIDETCEWNGWELMRKQLFPK